MSVRVSKIVESMRKVSKSAKVSEIGIVDITGLVEDVSNLCTEKIRRSLIELDLTQVAPNLKVVANYGHLSFTLMSLIFNAMEALADADEGHRHIILSTKEDDKYIYLNVKDSGPGISSDLSEKIFDPFFTTKPHSSGLGLSMSFKIIQEMGGNLRFIPSQDGACFEMRLNKQL